MQWDKVNELERKPSAHEESKGMWGPGKRYGHTLNVVQLESETSAFVVGGTTDVRKQTLGVCKYDTYKESWKRPKLSGPAPAVRENHTCTTIGSRLFIFGGRKSEETLGVLVILDTQTNQWLAPQTTGESPAPREGHAAALFGKALYIFGGCIRADSDDEDDVFHDDCFMLDTESLQWQRLRTAGERPNARTGHSMVAWKSSLVLFGGQDAEEGSFNDVHLLDTDTLEWRKLQTHGELPAPRAGHVTALIGNQMVIFGGVNKQEEKLFNEIHSLNLDTGTWRPHCARGTFPRHRFSAAAALVDGRGGDLLIYGGCDRNLAATSGFFVLLTGIGQSSADLRRLRKHSSLMSLLDRTPSKKRKTIIPTLSGHRATVDPETAALYFQTISRIAQKLGVGKLALNPEAKGHNPGDTWPDWSHEVTGSGHFLDGSSALEDSQQAIRNEAALQASFSDRGVPRGSVAGPPESGETILVSAEAQTAGPIRAARKLVPIRKGRRPVPGDPQPASAGVGLPRTGAVECRGVDNATESILLRTEAISVALQPSNAKHSVGIGTEEYRRVLLAASNSSDVAGKTAQEPERDDGQVLGPAPLFREAIGESATEAAANEPKNGAPCQAENVLLAAMQQEERDGFREKCATTKSSNSRAPIAESSDPIELIPGGVKDCGAVILPIPSNLEGPASTLPLSDSDTWLKVQASTVENGNEHLHQERVEAIREEDSGRLLEERRDDSTAKSKSCLAEGCGTIEASSHGAIGGWVSLNMPDIREEPPEEAIDLKIEALLQTGFSVSAQVGGQQLRGFLYSNNPKFLAIAQSLALKKKAEEKRLADVAAQERTAAREMERKAKAARKAESARTAQESLRVAALARAERPNPAPNPPNNSSARPDEDKGASKSREKKSRREKQASKQGARINVNPPVPQITRGYPAGFAPVMMQPIMPVVLPPPLLIQPDGDAPIVAPAEPLPVVEGQVAAMEDETEHVADEQEEHVAEAEEEHVAPEELVYEDAVAEHFGAPLESQNIEAAFVEEAPGVSQTEQAMLGDEQPDPTGDFPTDLSALYPPEVVPYVDPQTAYPGYEQTEGYGEAYNPNAYAIYEPHPGAFYAHDPYYGTYQVAQEGYPQGHVPYQYAAPEYQPGYPAHPDPYGHLAPVVHPVGAFGIQAPPIPYGAPVYGPVQPANASAMDPPHVTYQQQMYNMQVYGTPYDPSQWPAPPPQ